MTTEQDGTTTLVLRMADGRTITHTHVRDWTCLPGGRLQVLDADGQVVAEYPVDDVRRIRRPS